LSKPKSWKNKIDILAFKAGRGYFGVELGQIMRLYILTPDKVSKAGGNMPKVITLLPEEEFPLVDFNESLGLAKQEGKTEDRTTVIVVKSDDGPIGIMVDEVEDLYSLSPREVYPLPQHIRGRLPFPYIWGLGLIYDRLLLLIDTNKLPKKAEDCRLLGINHTQVDRLKAVDF